MRLGRDAPEKLHDDHACSDDLQLVLIGPNLVDFYLVFGIFDQPAEAQTSTSALCELEEAMKDMRLSLLSRDASKIVQESTESGIRGTQPRNPETMTVYR